MREERRREDGSEGEKSRSNRPTDAAPPVIGGLARTNNTPRRVTVMSRLSPRVSCGAFLPVVRERNCKTTTINEKKGG